MCPNKIIAFIIQKLYSSGTSKFRPVLSIGSFARACTTSVTVSSSPVLSILFRRRDAMALFFLLLPNASVRRSFCKIVRSRLLLKNCKISFEFQVRNSLETHVLEVKKVVHLTIKMSEKILTQHFDVNITLLSSDKIKNENLT